MISSLLLKETLLKFFASTSSNWSNAQRVGEAETFVLLGSETNKAEGSRRHFPLVLCCARHFVRLESYQVEFGKRCPAVSASSVAAKLS